MDSKCFNTEKNTVEKDNKIKKARFETNVPFINGCPCRLVEKDLKEYTDIGIPHYATTLEILITEKINGVVRIADNDYTVEERSVFVIPPNTIHSTIFMPINDDSRVFVFKISFDLLGKYLNTENLFLCCGHSLSDIPYSLTQHYAEITNILFNKISYDGNEMMKTISGIIRLFRILDDAIENHNERKTQSIDRSILAVMQWTTENLSEPITVEMAAQKASYSKYYFCKMFKKYTGNTYLKYLQLLRVNHAMELLKDGKTMTDCCYECGFSSLSHFVKLFKTQTGYKPSEYKRMIAQNNGGKNE